MKMILLRGLPGSGKTAIANNLAGKLNCSNIIHADDFKIEYKKISKNYSFSDACKYSYDKTIEKLSNITDKEIIIIEEIFNNKDFVKRINDFCEENSIKSYWFYIKRDMDRLLEVENLRERPIKNTRDDLLKLQGELDNIKIDDEKVVLNNDIDKSVDFILESIEL